MRWTDERVELLKQFWNEGLSASQIADQMGFISRNAVIGKAHRLKLAKRKERGYKGYGKKPEPKPKWSTTTRPESPDPQTVPKPSAVLVESWQEPDNLMSDNRASMKSPPVSDLTSSTDAVLIMPSRRLRLIELNEKTCRWPSGDPVTEEFSFCGNDAELTGRYCAYHTRLAYLSVSERRRLR